MTKLIMTLSIKLKQYNAALAITGAVTGTFGEKL